jgi:hypothetical protein
MIGDVRPRQPATADLDQGFDHIPARHQVFATGQLILTLSQREVERVRFE